MPAQVADGEDGREEHRGREHQKHHLRHVEDVGQPDLALGESPGEVLIELVRDVDDDGQDGEPQHHDTEDLPPGAQDVLVERLHAWRLRIRANQLAMPQLEPRACPPSCRTRKSRPTPTTVKMTFAVHIAKNGDTIRRSPRSSPTIKPM